MVDFLKVKINRLSDSVVLQHLWNSIDDLILCGLIPSKTNVIERCKTVYEVETSEINKNLFLALKEGTISRSVKTDVLSRIKVKEDKIHGDWYCFLCHRVGPDIRCQRCGTSFHNNCNSNLSDQFHCHTCLSKSQFSKDFQKFSPTTQLRIISRVIYANKIKWQSLNVVGYIEDESRNSFFIYKIVNAIEIDRRLSTGKYFSNDNNRENFLFDLHLLRHNCAVIYGIEHEFSKTITGFIKHLNTEIENIYCENCFLLFSRQSNQKLTLTQKQDLFCSVCNAKHPIMWGFVPPNGFWPFKMISVDNDNYYGIRFSRPFQINRQKLESFSKEISLEWSSYNLQMCDRPSLELLKALSMAQMYAQNLVEAQRLSISCSIPSSHRLQKVSKHKSPKVPLKPNIGLETVKKKIGRPSKTKIGCPTKPNDIDQSEIETIRHSQVDMNYPPKVKHHSQSKSKIVNSLKIKTHKQSNIKLSGNSNPKTFNESKAKIGRPQKKNKTIDYQTFDKRAFLDNLSSTDSSSENVHYLSDMIFNPKKRKRIKDVFNSDDEKPAKISKSSSTRYYFKRKESTKRRFPNMSTTDSESNSGNYKKTDNDKGNVSISKIQSRSRESDQVTYSSRKITKKSPDKNRHKSRCLPKHKIKCKETDSYSSDDTIPQHNTNKIYASNESQSELSELSDNDIQYNTIMKSRRSHNNAHTPGTYSAYSTPMSRFYNCYTPEEFHEDHSKSGYMENGHNILLSNGKDLSNSNCHNGNSETGRYCSSGSPVNFSPMSLSNNHQATVTQFPMQSTPPSSYQMNYDDAANQNGGNLNMRIVLKNRAFQVSSPLQLGINIDSKIIEKSSIDINSTTTKKSAQPKVNKTITTSPYSESEH